MSVVVVYETPSASKIENNIRSDHQAGWVRGLVFKNLKARIVSSWIYTYTVYIHPCIPKV